MRYWQLFMMLFIENFVSVTGLELIASKIISLFFLNCEQLDILSSLKFSTYKNKYFWYKSWHKFVKWHRTGPDERKTFLTEGKKFVREKWRNLEHWTKVWIYNARLRRTFHRYGTLFDKSYTGNHSNLIHILFPRSFVDLIW